MPPVSFERSNGPFLNLGVSSRHHRHTALPARQAAVRPIALSPRMAIRNRMPFMQPRVSAEKPTWLNAKGRIGSFALVLCSLAAGLLLSEIGVRLFAPQPINGIFFDFAPRGYMINKSDGTALFSLGENKGVYHLVSPHLRGLRPAPPGAERILALGDSFTFGWGLPEKDTYIARLQEKLDTVFGADQIALLNAGISGSGTAEHLAFLEDFGDEIAPAAVFVFVSIDDFNRAQRSPLYHLRSSRTYDLDAGSVPTSMLKKTIVPSALYNFIIQHSHLAQLIRRVHLLFLSIVVTEAAASEQLAPVIDSSPEQQRLVRAMFRRMKAWCDTRGIKLAVINNGWRTYVWLADLLVSERIAYFDAAPQVLPLILRNNASYVIAGDGHPNAAGDALTADAVWPFVRSFIDENKLQRKR
jgi:lysophospholipase L1-like esterase